MSIKNRGILVAIFSFALLISGCGGESSSVTSGTGSSGVSSDGGSSSAQFAGNYVGTITLTASGSEIDSDSEQPATLLVWSDGTAKLTIDGTDEIEGAMNGRMFGFSVRVIEEDGLVECDADAILTGSITGARATGTVSGSGECTIVTAKSGFTVGGSLSVTKS